MSYQVLIDLGKLKTLYSGLGQFSFYYGRNISKYHFDQLPWNFLTPLTFVKKFGHEWTYEKLSLQRRYFPATCKRYHLWHAIHQDSAYFPGNRSTPYILTIHDLNFLQEKNRFIASQRLKKLQRKVNKASCITFISRYTESIAKTNLQIHDIPTRVIYNGVDIESEKKVLRPSYLPEGKFLFTIGMILEKKNFQVLVDFMARMPGYNLIIAGDKSDFYAYRIEREIRKKGMEKRILLPGIISHEDKIYLYKNCEAFLFPSKMEGFGLPVIEAMRFGKPVFSSTYASLPEIGGKMAYYWDNFDPEYMKNIYHEKMDQYRQNQEDLSEKITDYSYRFDWDNSIKKYLEIYEETIKDFYDANFRLPVTKTGLSQEKNIRRIRILHLSSEKSWRGGEQQIAYLLQELNDQTENYIACRKGSAFEKYCVENGLDHYSLSFNSPFDLITAWRISEICKKNGIDVLHMHTSMGHTMGVLSTWFGHQSRLVLSRRVDVPIKKNAFSRWKYNHRRIERILTVSDAIKKILNGTLQDQSICNTVHSGIDLKKFRPEQKNRHLREKYSISDDFLLIGNTSALADHKDYFTFINTAEYVLDKGIKAKFLIIGEGPERKSIEKYIRDKKLEGNIILTGFITKINHIIPELDIFLMTSKTEGLGTSILDAFACNVPVVATRAGGIPEMVKHRITGLLSDVKNHRDLGENILQLIRQPDLRKKLTTNAEKLLMEEFTKEKTAQKTYWTYLDIVHV